MSSNLPLSRFRVLDLTIARAGPTAARYLADWGADVVSIEAPVKTGKNRTAITGRRHGYDFQNLHRNKRNIALDLKSGPGKEVFYKMVEGADVVLENFRADVKHRLGVDYETVRKINPRIVYGSISGFGQDGPYAKRPGVDQIVQGLGGLMSITGLPGGGPVRVGIPISDLSAGIFLASGVLMALLDREVTGEGQWVRTSLLESLIAMLDFQASRWLNDGEVPGQAGNNHPSHAPMGMFETADSFVNVAASSIAYTRLCDALGATELLERDDFATADLRLERREEVNAAFSAYFKKYKTQDLIELLNEAGVPCGPVNTIDQVFADPQVKHLGVAKTADHRDLGAVGVVRNPLSLSRAPHPDKMRRAAPESGEHSEEILAELGYSEEAVAELRRQDVI